MRQRRHKCSYLSITAQAANGIGRLVDMMERHYGPVHPDPELLEAWEDDVWEVTSRMGDEFQTAFIDELTRQVMRMGGKPYDVSDRILVATIVELTHRADGMLRTSQHPALELISRNRRNLLAPLGTVIFRGLRFVVRRNRMSVTVQMTGAAHGGEMSDMIEKLDDIIDEEACHVG